MFVGAGQNFAERLLKQFNPSMSEGEAKTKAMKMFATTKGRRYYTLKKEFIDRVVFDEGSFIRDNHLCMTKMQAMHTSKVNGKAIEEMFERPKWYNGTESDMFNQLEEIAGANLFFY